ncbi:MAG: hypothetical protein RLY93_13230 [Sumerlaeia bacterium]
MQMLLDRPEDGVRDEGVSNFNANDATARTAYDPGQGSSDVSQIIHDLAKYRLFTEDDGAAARQLYDQLLQAAGDDRQVASVPYDIGYSYGVERRWQ